MKSIQQSFSVQFSYDIHFTHELFDKNNPILKNIVLKDGRLIKRKLLFIIDDGVTNTNSELLEQIKEYTDFYNDALMLCSEPLVIRGGEQAKNDPSLIMEILEAINSHSLCRHSYIIAIGGGAVLDLVGVAASVAHRGIRHIRIPTTVLSQNDSGVGVKNGINVFRRKNFLGCFSPPYAVLNDFDFLKTLSDRDWRSGIAEAVKVALIKDGAFFQFIKENALNLNNRDMNVMKQLIHRCAELHLQHIASGDPFEQGSSRPLDFGHWAAHKLEQLTRYSLRHGEAVAIGIALDTTYSCLSGRLSEREWEQVISLLKMLEFGIYVPELSIYQNHNNSEEILDGLNEFREHLGGELTVMLLEEIGCGIEVNTMDKDLIIQSIATLEQWHNKAIYQEAI